jgi:hypothetical protein
MYPSYPTSNGKHVIDFKKFNFSFKFLIHTKLFSKGERSLSPGRVEKSNQSSTGIRALLKKYNHPRMILYISCKYLFPKQ